MHDEQLREMIRESIAKHLGVQQALRPGSGPAAPVSASAHGLFQPHVSQGMFQLTRGSDDDGACLIEPAADVEVYDGDAAMSAAELQARVAGKTALISLLTDAIDRSLIDAAPGL